MSIVVTGNAVHMKIYMMMCIHVLTSLSRIGNKTKRPGFSLLFDAMHGAGGPFARKVFLEELGLPEVSSKSLYCFGTDNPIVAHLGSLPVSVFFIAL